MLAHFLCRVCQVNVVKLRQCRIILRLALLAGLILPEVQRDFVPLTASEACEIPAYCTALAVRFGIPAEFRD